MRLNERTKQEQLLIQQSKLASMGNMIGNIAHQWRRQPLSEVNAILMSIQAQKKITTPMMKHFFKGFEECGYHSSAYV